VQSTRFRRTLIVLLLATLSVALWSTDLRRVFGHPLGVYGFDISIDNRVTNLSSESLAARAGVKSGMVVDFARMSPSDRLVAVWDETLNPGEVVHVALSDGRRPYDVHFATMPEPPQNLPLVIIRSLLALVLLAAGILVVLLKPSVATWAFFIFSLVQGGPVNVSTMVGPDWFRATAIALFWISLTLSSFAALIFALYLLHSGPLARWRRTVALATVALAAAACILEAWHVPAFVFYGAADPVLAALPFGIVILANVATPFILLATYIESQPQAQERLRWVIAGFTVNACLRSVDSLGGNGLIALVPISYAAHSALLAVSSFAVGLTVIYAILKHRIIDINVVVSRALVYTALSAMIVGVFAVVDLFFNRVLSESKAGLIADIALALILGFFFKGMHGRVDRLVDGLLFRTRHLAEKHLATVTSAMPYVKSKEHVDKLLIEEPVRALGLSGAHVAQVDRIAAPNTPTLVAYLEAEHHGLRLNEHGLRGTDFAEFEAAFAAPIFSHGDLTAIVFYGFHSNGTDVDGEEVGILERLADAAGTAYDHLEARALRYEVESLRAQLAAIPPLQRMP
jgi:hypothetical protein